MRNLLIGAGVIFGLVVLSAFIANPGVPTNNPLSQSSGDVAQDKSTPAPTSPKGTPQAIDPNTLIRTRAPLVLLNPAGGKPGSSIGVSGSGFDAGATVDIVLKRSVSDKGQDLGFVQADQGGSFGGFSFTIPPDLASGSFTLIARQHDGSKESSANGQVAGNSPVVTFATQVGQPGTKITFSANGFAPKETVNVFFNSITGDPVTTFQVSDSGGVRQESVTVPFGAVGNNSFIFVGDKSKSPVTVSFLMLNLYPTIELNNYATKADTILSFNGEGFGPGENIYFYLNSTNAPPVSSAKADDKGNFKEQGDFMIPFELRGKNTVVAMGELSQAPSTASFDVLPYTPFVEPSTYGGRPGTAVTFYANGFARNEIVKVYINRTKGSGGKLISCFQTDDQGSAVGGLYVIPSGAPVGTMDFAFVADRSRAEAVAQVEVMESTVPGPQSGEKQPDYVCPYDQEQAAAPTPAPPAQQQAPNATPQPTQAPPQPTQAAPKAATPQPSPTAPKTATPAPSPTAPKTATPQPAPKQ